MEIGAFELSYEGPQLENVTVFASLRPWVDVGRVGTLTLKKLEKYMGATEIGRLSRPGKFFDFTRERPHTSMVNGRRVLTKPNTIINHAREESTGRDFLFLHIIEPHMFGEDYSEAIVQVLEYYKVSEYCRIGSMWDSVPHTRPLMVTGTLNELHEEKMSGIVEVSKNGYEGPTSIVNLVGDTLSDSGVQTSSLMLHIPHYVQLDEDYKGVSKMIEVLGSIYDFPHSLAETGRGDQQYQEITRAVEENPSVKQLVKQLEAEYDRGQINSDHNTILDPTLPPEVENFLNEMGQRFEEGPADSEETLK